MEQKQLPAQGHITHFQALKYRCVRKTCTIHLASYHHWKITHYVECIMLVTNGHSIV